MLGQLSVFFKVFVVCQVFLVGQVLVCLQNDRDFYQNGLKYELFISLEVLAWEYYVFFFV